MPTIPTPTEPWPPPIAVPPFLPITPLSTWRPPFGRLPLLPTDYVYIEADPPKNIEFQPSMTYTHADANIERDLGQYVSFGLNILNPLPEGPGENFSAVWIYLDDKAPLITGMHLLHLPRYLGGNEGLSYIGSVGCNHSESELIVDLALYDLHGDLLLMQLRFEQICDNGDTVRGEIRWTPP